MDLLPFNDSDGLFNISGTLRWVGNILAAEYIVRGPLQNIRGLSHHAELGSRSDNLWKTTCFEWFLKPIPGEAYWEANFTSAGDWNLYHLDGYRKDLRPELRVSSLDLIAEKFPTEWRLKTRIDFSALAFPAGMNFQAHLSAVIETVDDQKNYWSLRHTQKKPDFHHPDHFILEIQKES